MVIDCHKVIVPEIKKKVARKNVSPLKVFIVPVVNILP